MKPAQVKSLINVVLILALGLFFYADYYLWRLLKAGAGIEAKMLCSSVFISNRDPESVLDEDIHHRVNYIRLEVDAARYTVTATAFGFIQRHAVFRKGIGSTLLSDVTIDEFISMFPVVMKTAPVMLKTQPWPTGDIIEEKVLPPEIKKAALTEALDKAFSEPYPDSARKTRAIVILYNGEIVAERYASGFTPEMPLLGYGMAKSVINVLTGILVGQGKLSLNDSAPVPEWSNLDDPRNKITLDQLLRMSSGLEFNDGKPPLTDSVLMFGIPDMAAFAALKPLVEPPNTVFNLSNGTTNIIARIIKTEIGNSDEEYLRFPQRELFEKIGMRSAIIEPDAAGTFVGSTYMYATARDWARFGLFLQRDGIWENERILPEGWLAYSTKPTSTDPRGEFGAHFWTNANRDKNGDSGQWPHVPSDAFFALGHNGQSLTVIPSRKLVIVRLGLTKKPEAWNLDTFLADIMNAFPEAAGE